MKSFFLISMLLLGQAAAVKFTLNVVPKLPGTKVLLVPVSDPSEPGCDTEGMGHRLADCRVSPGTYTLSVFPSGDYGAIIDRPITINQASTLTIKLSPPTASGHSISEDWSSFTYKVKSTCPTDVTYSDGGDTQQESSVDSGWNYDTPKGTTAYLSAQLTCTTGYVTAYIILGGKVIKQASSHGDYVIAQVSYP